MSTVEKKPYIHLSIDDTFEIFKDLAQNAMYYSSIFERLIVKSSWTLE